MCAIIDGGILGITTGKIGPVIAYYRNGKNCIRSKGDYTDRKSDLQVVQRDRFRMITEIGARAYQNIIKPAMIKATEGLNYSAWHLFVRLNTLADDVFNKRYNLQISSGVRKVPTVAVCQINTQSLSFYISWDATGGQNANPTDMISIYRLKVGSYILEPISENTLLRSAGSYSIVVSSSADYLGHTFLVFAKSTTGVYSSTSGKYCIDAGGI
jgi:hypothetical protein